MRHARGDRVEKRGAPFTKADTLFRDYYSADTVTTYTCSGAATSYLWGGLDFYKVALAPSPKSESPISLRPRLFPAAPQHGVEVDGLRRPERRPEVADVAGSAPAPCER